LRFEPFVELISKFKTKSLDEKIDRFFKIIDEDGNGELSYEEISNLVFTSLRGHRVLTDEDRTFF
jgi:Ca2+-binding EF-hand superfamily protein